MVNFLITEQGHNDRIIHKLGMSSLFTIMTLICIQNKKSGERTHPWGEPVEEMKWKELFYTLYADWLIGKCLLAGTFFSEPAVSFFPVTAAILARYWMTLLVFTVFPAPDSPLESNIATLRCSTAYRMLPYLTCKNVFSINLKHLIDLRDQNRLIFSVCGRKIRKDKTILFLFRPIKYMLTLFNLMYMFMYTVYLTTCTGRHCQRWRRCGVELRSSSCLCRSWLLTERTPAASCRGWQSRRTALSRSVEEDLFVSFK